VRKLICAPGQDERRQRLLAQRFELVTMDYPVDFGSWLSIGEARVELKVWPSDFLASLKDGRLQQQCAALHEAQLGGLLIEGPFPSCAPDGSILDGQFQRKWKLDGILEYLMTIQDSGIKLLFSPRMSLTPMVLDAAFCWWEHGQHQSLYQRPAASWEWGEPSDREQAIYFLQGLPGIGPTYAEALHNEGEVWETLEKIRDGSLRVRGIGPKMREAMQRVLAVKPKP